MRKNIVKIAVALLAVLAVAITAGAKTVVYKVRSGDSLSKIAKQYQISLKELLQANPQIKDPSKTKAGDSVTIPNADSVSALEAEVLRLVNAERTSRKLPPLALNSSLSSVARLKSQDFINKNYFAHQSPTYGSPFDMMKKQGIGFVAAGENIAKGQNTAAAVMKSWMASPGHKANILSAVYNQIGIGTAKDSKGNLYWTQMFIKSK